MLGAHLQGAILEDVNLLDAILPDGKPHTFDTEMDRFTNPNHRDYIKTLEYISEIRKEMWLNRKTR